MTRLFSYHVAPHVQDGRLAVVLADHEPAPLPVHLLSPQGRLSVPTVRAFADFAVPRLRNRFRQFAAATRQASADAGPRPTSCA